MSESIDGYADALLAVAKADGKVPEVKSELADFARTIAGNDELRTALSNQLLPAATRIQIVEDVLGNQASGTTRALVSMVVGSGRGAQFGEIVDAFVSKVASGTGSTVATVRSAVPLSEDQQKRLAQALKTQTGGDVDLQVVIDASVVGGAVTTIGDSVIDGSLRTRLNQMREVL